MVLALVLKPGAKNRKRTSAASRHLPAPVSSSPSVMSQYTADPHAHRHLDVLFAGSVATITDITCTCPRSPCGPERQASAYELVFVRTGIFVKHHSVTQRREIAAQPAHVLLLNRGESYRISHPSSRGDSCTVIAYDAETVRRMADAHASKLGITHGRPFPISHTVLTPSLALRFQRLRVRLRTATITPDEVTAEAATLLAIVLEAAWAQYRDLLRQARFGRSRRRRDITETVKEALARHPAATTSLQDLATYVGVSPFYLARTFRHEAGLPIHQYLLRVRLGTALERMSDASVRLSAIALDTGFSSPSHFTSAFKKAFGVAPTEWRALALSRGDDGGAGVLDTSRRPIASPCSIDRCCA